MGAATDFGLSEFFEGFLAILLMFFAPFLLFSVRCDNTVQDYVHNKAVRFADACCTTGKIEDRTFQNFIDELDATGYSYDITITTTSGIAIPEYEISESGEETFTGSFIQTEEAHSYSEILETIYDDGKPFYMHEGDSIQITVRRRTETVATRLLKQSQVYVNYSSVVLADPQF